MKILLETFADWLGGTRVISGFELDEASPLDGRIYVDSREVKPGGVFVCIKGSKQDGHDFYLQAIQNGARGIITERLLPVSEPGVFQIHTDSTTQALKRLAFHILQHIHPKTVGITGSAGKTTVRSMLESVFNSQYSSYGTIKNYNTPIGVPLSIASMPEKTAYFMCELSASYPGEIGEILSFLALDHAIITGIGPSHLAFLINEEGVFFEKIKIAEALLPSGNLWINGDQKWAEEAKKKKIPLKTFGLNANHDFYAHKIRWKEDGMSFNFSAFSDPSLSFVVQGWGLHLVQNAVVALALAFQENIASEKAFQGLYAFTPETGRGRILRKNDSWTLWDESYNANPYSMRASLDALSNVPFFRKIVVLGDMLELGEQALPCHQELGRQLSAYPQPLEAIIYVGEFGEIVKKELSQRNERFIWTKNWRSALDALLSLELTQRLIMVKASNGIGLHHLVNEMKQQTL